MPKLKNLKLLHILFCGSKGFSFQYWHLKDFCIVLSLRLVFSFFKVSTILLKIGKNDKNDVLLGSAP